MYTISLIKTTVHCLHSCLIYIQQRISHLPGSENPEKQLMFMNAYKIIVKAKESIHGKKQLAGYHESKYPVHLCLLHVIFILILCLQVPVVYARQPSLAFGNQSMTSTVFCTSESTTVRATVGSADSDGRPHMCVQQPERHRNRICGNDGWSWVCCRTTAAPALGRVHRHLATCANTLRLPTPGHSRARIALDPAMIVFDLAEMALVPVTKVLDPAMAVDVRSSDGESWSRRQPKGLLPLSAWGSCGSARQRTIWSLQWRRGVTTTNVVFCCDCTHSDDDGLQRWLLCPSVVARRLDLQWWRLAVAS
jgi:hypothetical protein